MYKCICHAVKDGDIDSYHLIGTKCGKCVNMPLCEKKHKKYYKKLDKLIKKKHS